MFEKGKKKPSHGEIGREPGAGQEISNEKTLESE